jgi:hypothetical protein
MPIVRGGPQVRQHPIRLRNLVTRGEAEIAELGVDRQVAVACIQVTRSLAEALLGAVDGRVESAFIALGEERWGHFDPASRKVEVHEERRLGDEDLLDRLAIQTLDQSGAAYVVPRSEIPGGGLVAVVFRYAVPPPTERDERPIP